MKLLKRKIDKYLLDWINNPKRKPLIVKGARQIGKTESIRAFGEANYESVIEINFVLQKKFRAIFNDSYEETWIQEHRMERALLHIPLFSYLPPETFLEGKTIWLVPTCFQSSRRHLLFYLLHHQATTLPLTN